MRPQERFSHTLKLGLYSPIIFSLLIKHFLKNIVSLAQRGYSNSRWIFSNSKKLVQSNFMGKWIEKEEKEQTTDNKTSW